LAGCRQAPGENNLSADFVKVKLGKIELTGESWFQMENYVFMKIYLMKRKFCLLVVFAAY